MSLVLNLKAGLGSPKFHILHDEFFDTVGEHSKYGISHSFWQRITGFEKIKNILYKHNKNDDLFYMPISSQDYTKYLQSSNVLDHQQRSSNALDHQIGNEYDTEFVNNQISYPEQNDYYDQIDGDENNDIHSQDTMDNPTPTTAALRRSARIRRPTWKVKDNQDRGIC